jgi:hypothetical protein
LSPQPTAVYGQRPGTRLSLELAMHTLFPWQPSIKRALRALPDWAKRIAKIWLNWFWHLGTTAMIVATAVEIVLLWFALPHVPLVRTWRTVILEFGSVGLCFLLVAGILFGGPRRT